MIKKQIFNNNHKANLTGFTIIEVLFALFILTTVALSSFSLIQQFSIISSSNESRMTAYYLAQQEIEKIKNIRDLNYLQINPWREGIITSSATSINFLNGETSKFSREIQVREISADVLEIKVIIFWKERVREQSAEVISFLYNWYN